MAHVAVAGNVKVETPANQSIDPDYGIHKCGMEADLRRNGFDKYAVQEQVLGHSHAIVQALLAGTPVPVHPRPGIQLLATHVANVVIAEGAQGLAMYMEFDLDDLSEQATSAHISSC